MSEPAPPDHAAKGAPRARRFYTQVEVAPLPDAGGYKLLLDGKPLRTPEGAIFRAPDANLATICADEWRAQGAVIVRETLILTHLLFAANDDPAGLAIWAQAEWARFAASDLLYYWPEGDPRLVAHCDAHWQPILLWAEDILGTKINRATGLRFAAQDPEFLFSLDRILSAQRPLTQGAMGKLAGLFGSALLALAVARGRLPAAEAFRLSRLDEDYQAEIWGEDSEAVARATALKAEVLAFAPVLTALNAA